MVRTDCVAGCGDVMINTCANRFSPWLREHTQGPLPHHHGYKSSRAGALLRYVQSLCKSLREKVRAQPPEKYHELLLPITPPPMGKTIRRELSPVEKGMIIPLFGFFAKSLLFVSLQAALGQPLKASFSGLQNVVISRTSLDLGDPKNLPNVNSGTSGE